MTTANNHCLDRGVAGMLRTLSVLDKTGLAHTGTFSSQEDRETPVIFDVNGLKIGFLSFTTLVNGNQRLLPEEDQTVLLAYVTNDLSALQRDIDRLRAAGAEFIVAMPHWDCELILQPADETRKMSTHLLEMGIDVIVGAHPHVVQSVERITVSRKGTSYTGLVVYSLGNFLSNMSQPYANIGMFLRLHLTRDASGAVILSDAAYIPTICRKVSKDGDGIHTVFPALSDMEGVSSVNAVINLAKSARKHLEKICGNEDITMLDGKFWKED